MTDARTIVLAMLTGMMIGVVLFTLGYRMLTQMWPWEHL